MSDDNNFTCLLLAAQSGKEPVPHTAGAGDRLGGGIWGWQVAGVKG